MKRLKYLLLILLIPVVASAYTGSSGMDVSTCRAFADYYKNITGSYEYKYCYRAACSTEGTWNIANMSSMSGYHCTNGNATPYTKWTSDGCSKFTGKCQVNEGIFCTKVRLVDCDKNADGTPYNSPTNTQSQSVGTKPSKTVTASQPSKTVTQSKTRKTGVAPTGTIATVTKTTEDPELTRPTVETEPLKSSNVNIKYITINGTDLKYINGYDEYTIKLPYNVLDLDVFVATEDEKTIAYIDGAYDMPNEDTTINIRVVAEDGTEKNIKINVKRYTGESGDCNISNISISDYELTNFDKNNYQYVLKVDRKTKSLYMDIVPSDPLHATVEVVGNDHLANNSLVTINVKAENGTLCSYNITIKKTSGVWIPIVIIIIVAAVLIAIGYFVYRYIKRSRDTYKYE